MGSCGDLYLSVVAGVMIDGVTMGRRLAVCEGVRYIFMGALELSLSVGI